MTQTAAVVGTAQYLSPEQARGETVDSRSDVYSTGCLLYELLTGRPPFVGDSPVAVAYQHVREPARPPSDHDTDLPAAVDAIVMKALAKRVEDRYQSAAAMRADIERYLAGRPVQAPVPPPMEHTQVAMPPAPLEQTMVRPPLPPDDDRRGPRAGVLILLALLVVALVVAAVLAFKSSLFESAPEQVQVPNLIGMSETDARAAIGAAGLSVGEVGFQASEDVEKDQVISQDPNRDQYVEPGTSVDLVVSTGRPLAEVPFLVGASKDEARTRLRDAKLKVTFEVKESDEQKGQVLSTDPAGGESVPQGSTVTVVVSDGQEKVPQVIGLTRKEAEEAIRDAGFVPEVRDDPASTEPNGTVTDQFPRDGVAAEGSTVIVFVSTFVEPTPTPTPTPTPSPLPTQPPTPLPTRVSPGTPGPAWRTTGPAGRHTPER
jgi:beta-lactam-binding protein with PASTA domain